MRDNNKHDRERGWQQPQEITKLTVNKTEDKANGESPYGVFRSYTGWRHLASFVIKGLKERLSVGCGF